MEVNAAYLNQLGKHIGSAIIAFDCAVDRDKDRRCGQYNPLTDGNESIVEAFALCRQQLRLAALASRKQFGAGSHAGRVLEQVAERIPHGCRVPVCQRLRSETKTVFDRLGVGRRKGLQLNSGFDVVIGIIAFLGVCVGGLACLNTSARQAKAERQRRLEEARAADAPSDPNAPPSDPVDAAAAAAAAGAATSTGRKRKGGCGDSCDCFCWACDDDCCNCAFCAGDGAMQGADCSNIDCSGCDGCGNLDCNCN
jgi:hypothetical protein